MRLPRALGLHRVEHTQIGAMPSGEEGMPRVILTRKRALALGFFVVSVVAFLYFVLPKIAGLRQTWDRLGQGAPGWLAVAAVFEALSFAGYVALFRTVFVRAGRSHIDWRASYEITMAGLAATRLFAAAGSGGVALTVWALRRAGLDRRTVAAQMVAFITVLYGVYMSALVVFGVGLRTRVLPGGGGFAITMLPAIFGGLVIALFLALTLVPADIDRRAAARTARGGRGARVLARLLALPALAATGVRGAVAIVRSRDPRAHDRDAVGVLQGVRRIADGRRRGDGLLCRHVRQRAAAAGRDRRCRRRHDRRVPRVRRQRADRRRRRPRLPRLRLLAANAARRDRLLSAASPRGGVGDGWRSTGSGPCVRRSIAICDACEGLTQGVL